ncbi:MAG: ribonuclease III [Planctomycetota bacterium]|nr:ribonuclease III [Planctomycetota bacterium]
MSDAVLAAVQAALNYTFRTPALLRQALVHASVVESRVDSNERMEFLGDAVLGLIACKRIYEKFPLLLEGDMTKIKSMTVSRNTCAAIATQLGLTDHLSLGKGMRTNGTLPSSLAAAALESVIAAIYVDGGYEAAERFVLPHLDPLLDQAAASGHHQNFKSVLQQHAQQTFGTTPVYRTLDEQGPDHAKCFKVCVELGGRRFESFWAPSRKRAEQLAALAALREMGIVEQDSTGEIRVRGAADERAALEACGGETPRALVDAAGAITDIAHMSHATRAASGTEAGTGSASMASSIGSKGGGAPTGAIVGAGFAAASVASDIASSTPPAGQWRARASDETD